MNDKSKIDKILNQIYTKGTYDKCQGYKELIHLLNCLKETTRAVLEKELTKSKDSGWIDAEKEKPIDNGAYLVILKTWALSQHCKRWAGVGEPEIAIYHEDFPYGWSARGSL